MIIHDKSRKQSTCVILGNLRKKISKHTTKTQSTKFLPILPTDTCPKVKADLPLGQFYYSDMKKRLRIFSLFLTPFSTNLDEQTYKAPRVSTIILHTAINMPHDREWVRKLSEIIHQVMLKTEPIFPDSLWHNQCLPHYLRTPSCPSIKQLAEVSPLLQLLYTIRKQSVISGLWRTEAVVDINQAV